MTPDRPARAVCVIAEAEAAVGAENKVREAILAGVDPSDAYRRFGKF